MREPPALLDQEALPELLRAAYDLAVATITFLPLGLDSSAAVYRVELADGTLRFLKVRSGAINEAGLRVPHLLQSQGVRGVVAPIPTASGALWANAGPWSLILYPFVEGATGMEAGLSERQWESYGATLRQIHTAPIPLELATSLRRETYNPRDAALLRQVDRTLQGPLPDYPHIEALAAFWGERRPEILQLLERAEALGEALRRRNLPLVICHADIHTGNVIGGADEQVWIIDWDEVMLAPKERDLMFVIKGIGAGLVGPEQEARCLKGYGPASIDAEALTYYRYAWAVADIAAFGAEALLRDDLGMETRAAAVEWLRSLFAPGNIVDIAREERAA